MFGKKEKAGRESKSLSSIDSEETTVSRNNNPLHPPGRQHTSDTLSQPPQYKMRHSSYFQHDDTRSTTSSTTMGSQKLSGGPRPLVRVPTTQTRYMEMLLHLDQIPRSHNILVAACTWILLAGFLVVPGTFTSFKNSAAFKSADDNDSNTVAHAIVHSIANIGLLWVSGACCAIGGLGCLFMWFRWRQNYVWLLNRIFMPVSFNAAAGLLTTVVNVYTAQQGVWSRSAKIAGSVTGGCLGVAGTVFILYNFWALEKVRDLHEREFDPEGWERKQQKKAKEGLMAKLRRKLYEKPTVPGSSEV